MTDRCKPEYPPLFQSGGIITLLYSGALLAEAFEIFDEKVLRNYGRTDGRNDGQM